MWAAAAVREPPTLFLHGWGRGRRGAEGRGESQMPWVCREVADRGATMGGALIVGEGGA